MGRRGALVVDGDCEATAYPGPLRIEAVDPTGAGDAFAAKALAVPLSVGLSLRMRPGARASSPH